ncbi:MAG TPA: FAD-dependent oxidoreductase, partial [Chloroflexota bacterium]|nr:FAD-dependent oxidoreductase [Chloroflexota bacterium]
MEGQIVILGAGYGGLTVARELGRALGKGTPGQVVLVDASAYHELKPKIPEAVGEWTDCAVRVPIQDVLAPYPGVRFVQARVTGLDRVGRQVLTDAGPIPYGRLVWALGSQPDFAPGGTPIPGLAAFAIAPYTFGAACRLRHQVG